MLWIVRIYKNYTTKKLDAYGADGVMTPEDAVRMQAAGADLIQIYSTFTFSGLQLLNIWLRLFENDII